MECNLTMDNDSGYVSHYPESNLDSSFEPADRAKENCAQVLYLNDDTLLEKPPRSSNKECKHYDSFDSVINSSQESVKTEFSGFNDSSDASFVIPEAEPIIYYMDECTANKNPINASSSKSSLSHKVLTNVTNTYDQNQTQAVIRNAQSDKENIPPQPSLTPKKPYENLLSSDISPDLFGEEESSLDTVPKRRSPMKKVTPKENHCQKDRKLLRNVQSSLSGVHPPPSVTIVQMNVTEMLERINGNRHLFWNASSAATADVGRSLLLNDKPDCVHAKWPDVLKSRYHGLHHNRSTISEDFEHLCLKYAERYVGAETQSSCTVFDSNPSSSQKRKLSKPRWNVRSPGRRLSHLARRRITFSSANLQASSSSAILGSRARQILVDARKLNALRKSPRKSPRKTPSKSPFKIRKNTPSSSAKKKLAIRFREMSGEFDMMVASTSSDDSGSGLSFKRALFPSGRESAPMEKKGTKRALFVSPLKRSPNKKSPLKFNTLDKKRKRIETEVGNPSKMARRMSLDTQSTSRPESNSFLNRTLSDTFTVTKTEELSDQHKKKLQWAVYESLRLQNVMPTHPQYKVFASVLARVTRKFLPNLRFEGPTSEKMFRVARHHSYAVVKGKTVDEIFNEYMRNRMRNQKPQGYVGIEEFRARENTDKENNVLQNKANVRENNEKRDHVAVQSRSFSQSRIDRIKKVISFEETE